MSHSSEVANAILVQLSLHEVQIHLFAGAVSLMSFGEISNKRDQFFISSLPTYERLFETIIHTYQPQHLTTTT